MITSSNYPLGWVFKALLLLAGIGILSIAAGLVWLAALFIHITNGAHP